MNRKIKILSIFIIVFFGFFAYFNQDFFSKKDYHFETYNKIKHHDFMLEQFKDNWFCLISTPDYDVEFMLNRGAPNTREPQFFDKMITDLIYYQGQPAGFCSYFMRTEFLGDILFIEVNEKFRGKKLAEKLVYHAIDCLKKQGANAIKILTREENKPAQKVYPRCGFKVVKADGKYVYYRKYL